MFTGPSLIKANLGQPPLVGGWSLKDKNMGVVPKQIIPPDALAGSLREYRDPQGADLLGRVEAFFEWQDLRRRHGLWPYSKSTQRAPLTVCEGKDDAGNALRGVNFASQDYLSLASHPAIKDTARLAIDEYGVHSAGSAAFLGNTKYSLKLQDAIAGMTGMEHVVLYPTGYAAGAGIIKGLIRPDDHIVIDGLAHACLHDGANAATRNIYLHGHLNIRSARRHLSRIRARDTKNAILVVTEGLFSMDSDTPDLAAMQQLCHEYNATLMVDVAHDFGCLGDHGRGQIGMQGRFGQIDIVMGSFSKTFASNGGFVATRSQAVKEYLRYFSTPGTFSNALSPIQSAIVLKACEIIGSGEGDRLRSAMMANVLQLRAALQNAGFEVYGDPSAIVSVKIGDEGLARLMSRRLPALGIIANLVEYPAVAKGNARFRLQVQAAHTADQVRAVVHGLGQAMEGASQDCRASGHRPTVSADDVMAPA
jgi:7-keto-8-aminopelargonate synthetase-like enzyme